MSAVPFVVELIVAAIITLVVLHQYGNWRKQHWVATLAVLISWFFSFLIVFILPLDVSATCYRECVHRQRHIMVIPTVNSSGNWTPSMNHTLSPIELSCQMPWSFMPKYVLPDMWRIVYWSSQILSWLILPMMQSYVYAGEFTVLGKIKRALYENALWYGSYLVIFGVLLIYVAVRPELKLNGEQLKIIGITASNTWGLLLLVLLLGYGLVEFPRNAWNASIPGHRLSYSYFKISKLSTEKEEAEEQLANVLEEVTKASEEIRYNSNLRKHVDTIISKCPDASQEMFNKGTDDYIDYDDVHGRTHVVFSEKALVKLHRRVIVVTHREHRAQAQWNNLLQKSFDLEDVEKNRDNRERMYKTSFSDHQPRKSVIILGFKWYWRIWLQPLLFKLLSIVLLLFSIALVWSEVTFFSKSQTLSIFALLTSIAKEGYLYFYIELVSFFTVAYMCACTYYTVFKMRLFNYYYFAPKHQTDENSLLFSGILLCRLTYALSLNFLALIHLDGHVTNINTVEETSFTSFMGHMDVMSIISKGLNVYYPMIVLLVCLCTFFHLGSRILHCFGVEQFLIDEDLSTEYINEGKDIVRRERRRIQKAISGGKDWSQRATQIRQKYPATLRERDGRIDDNMDEVRIDSHTKLSEPKVPKYSKYGEDDDRVQLLDNIEYEPTANRSSGYTGLSGITRSNAPKNIFDDI